MRVAVVFLLVTSVAAVIWGISSDGEGWDLLRSVGVRAAAALIVLQGVGLLTQAYRYWLTVDHVADTRVPPLVWLRLFILGRFLNSLLPQAGNAYRSLRLKEDYGIAITKYLSSFLAFVWLSTLVNLAGALAVVLVAEPGLAFGPVPGSVVVTTLLVGFAVGPPAALWILRRFSVESSSRMAWLYRHLEDMVAGAVRVAQSGATVGRFVLAAAAGLGIWIAVFAITFAALDIEVSTSAVVVFYVLQQLGTYVNITPGNLGVQELYSGALASQLGVGLTGGLIVAAIVRITALATLLVFGSTLGGWQALRQVRHPAAEPTIAGRQPGE